EAVSDTEPRRDRRRGACVPPAGHLDRHRADPRAGVDAVAEGDHGGRPIDRRADALRGDRRPQACRLGGTEPRAMIERPRDFIGYGRRPPVVRWPHGARLALNIAINYEDGSATCPLEGDRGCEALTEVVFPASREDGELASESIFECGSRVGVWRIMRTLDKYDATCSVFACGLALERNPELVHEFVERGYDMVGHGYRALTHFGMTRAAARGHHLT